MTLESKLQREFAAIANGATESTLRTALRDGFLERPNDEAMNLLTRAWLLMDAGNPLYDHIERALKEYYNP